MSESAKEHQVDVPVFGRDPLNEKGRQPTADAKAAGEASNQPHAPGGRGVWEEKQQLGKGAVAKNRGDQEKLREQKEFEELRDEVIKEGETK